MLIVNDLAFDRNPHTSRIEPYCVVGAQGTFAETQRAIANRRIASRE
jgi:hypothetical protein